MSKAISLFALASGFSMRTSFRVSGLNAISLMAVGLASPNLLSNLLYQD